MPCSCGVSYESKRSVVSPNLRTERMKLRRFRPPLVAVCLLVMTFLVLSGTALAAVEDLTLEELVSRARLIVRGRVIDTTARWNADHTRIYTYVTIRPTEYIKGASKTGDLVIEVPGGTVGDLTLRVTDVPTFKEGEDTVVFLRDEYFQVVGWYQGKYTVEEGIVLERKQPLQTFIAEIRQAMRGTAGYAEHRLTPKVGAATLTRNIVRSSSQSPDTGLSLSTNGPAPQAAWESVKYENFEGEFPGEWWVFDNDGTTNGEYYWGKRGCRPYPGGTYSGWAVGAGAQGSSLGCFSNYPNNAKSWMVYGPFSLVDAADAEVLYQLWLNSESDHDPLYVVASTDGSAFYGLGWTGESGGWMQDEFDLTAVPTLGNLCGQSNVWVAFIFNSDGTGNESEGAYVDEITIRRLIGQPQHIDSIVPNSGPAHAAQLTESGHPGCAADSTSITINGSNFGATQGTSYVRFQRQGSTYYNACVDSWSDTQIQARVPGGVSSGDVYVVVDEIMSNGYPFAISYSYLGGKWTKGSYGEPMPELYKVNPNCGDTTGELAAVQSAANTWTDVTDSSFYFRDGGSTGVTEAGLNGENEIMWVPDTGGSIATTHFWWYGSDPHQIVEFDMEFDDGHYDWWIGSSPGKMDVQNIATHELGHALGLDDLYGAADAAKTMYGFATTGETQKRTLATGDIAGVRYIYPLICYSLAMSANPPAGGSVVVNTVPNCAGGKYESSSLVSMTANANTGYGFTCWSGDASGSANPGSVSMDADKSVNANFLQKPTLRLPPGDWTGCEPPAMYWWYEVDRATSYDIQVDDDPGFGSPEIDATTPDSTPIYYPGVTLSPGAYYWRVRASDSCGDGPWSDSRSFTIYSAPSAPTLSAPPNGSFIWDTTPDFDWLDVSGATSYHIEVDNNADFSSPEIDATPPNSTYTPPSALGLGMYYWHVNASEAVCSGPWSSEWSFVAVAPQAYVPLVLKSYP